MSFMVNLDCPYRHSVEFVVSPPKIGETVWCLRCQEYRKVTHAPAEYRIRCRSCRYSRTFGRAKITAEMKAASHRSRNPSHTVVMYDGREVVHTFAPAPTSSLFDSLD